MSAPFALGVGLFGLDIAAYTGGVTGALPPAVAISAHLLAVAFAMRAAFRARRSSTYGMTIQLAVWLLLAGPFGIAIWLAALTAHRSTSDDGRLADWVDDQIDRDPVEALAAVSTSIVDDRVRLEGAGQTVALHDVLADGAAPAQLRALGVLARLYDARFAPTLDLGLRSLEASVRVLAASALARLQQRHSDKIAELTSAASPRALGAAHLAFARSGLLNAERREGALVRAHEAFVEAIVADQGLAAARAGVVEIDRERHAHPRLLVAPLPALPPRLAMSGRLS
jgi:hypothetical protein